jgi:outer membrane protein
MNMFSDMKTKAAGLLCTVMFLVGASSAHAADAKKVSMGTVNFKTCVEQSKIGKQEQSTFEAMKKQMESILEDKEKSLNEIAAKFNDPDYLDSLAPEAETELKRKFRALSQELTQQQNQYYQTLNQANYKIILKISEVISKAAAEVAEEKKLDIIMNDEGSFYHAPDLDVSILVVAKMDAAYDKEAKEKPAQPAAPAAPAAPVKPVAPVKSK